jgi:4-amino-4-deoxy-L-arabinose transferase-like glycosyltransferase
MGFEAGRAGVLRLFNRQMGGQASWLVIFGLIGAAVAVSKMKRPLFKEPRSQAVLLWLVWFFTLAVYFSTAGFFHRYYLNLIAPSIAALCGISVTELWQSYREKGWRGWILPLALLATAGVQAVLLIPYPAWVQQLGPGILILGMFSFLALAILRIIRSYSPYLPASILALGLTGLLIAPAVWSITTITHGVSASMPVAGPGQSMGPMRNPGANLIGLGFMGINEGMNITKLVDFLKRNRKEEKFLLAVPNARLAWDIILETGDPVMAMGGFMGMDNILTVENIDHMVKNGDVRYFLVRRMPQIPAGARPIQPGTRPALGGIFGGAGALREIDKWIEEHGTLVPDEAWKDTTDLNRERPTQAAIGWLPFTNIPFSALRPGIRGSLKLYDLRPESTKS